MRHKLSDDEKHDKDVELDAKRKLSANLRAREGANRNSNSSSNNNSNKIKNNNDNSNDHKLAETTNGIDTDRGQSLFKAELVWFNIFLFVIIHSFVPVAIYLIVTEWPLRTSLWVVFCAYISALGVTGGTHRLWSHRSYKASLPVELLLMLLQTMAGQNSIWTWSRDHRVHHKFAETDADPHNIKRGFFFAHMGWLCCRKHPEVKAKGALIDMSDLKANRVVMFQHRHFWWLSIVFNLALPTLVPYLAWGERLWTSFVLSFALRYLLVLHGTWLVNSAAHYFGPRPYDKRIEARESPGVILMGLGEGFHNYHHTFPFDYSTSEFGRYFNITTAFIDLCAALGLVSERRMVSREMITRRQLRTGDQVGQAGQAAARKELSGEGHLEEAEDTC